MERIPECPTNRTAAGRDALAARIVAASKPEGIIAILRLAGFHGLADRVECLYGLAEDAPDEPSVVFASLREWAIFLASEPQYGEPDIGFSPDGLVQSQWSGKDGGVVVMNYLPDGSIQFAAPDESVIGDGRRRRVNGTLPKDEALQAVRPFTY